MLHVVILTKARGSGKFIHLRPAAARLGRDKRTADHVFTSSDQSFNRVPSIDGSGPDPLGKVS